MTGVQSWLNKGTNGMPAWALPYMIGERAPNGSFMIGTMAGTEKVQARVLVGHMLIERKGVAYTRHPTEAKGLLAELEAEDAPPPPKDAAPSRQKACEAVGADRQRTTRKPQASAKKPADIGRESTTPIRGQMPSIEWVQLERLEVDDSYQRSVETGPSRALIERIGREWDWRLCVPLMVSRRLDGLYVIDGQHRLSGARKRQDVPQLPCCISVYDGPADEAAMFVAANRERRAMNRLDDFHAALAADDVEAGRIKALVEAAGFTVSRTTGSGTWKPGEVAFTSAIRSVHRKHGDGLVAELLHALADAFPDEVLVTGGSLFTGLSRILVTPPPGLDKARLFLALKRFDAAGWASFISGMKGGTDRGSAMREALLMAYEEVVP